MDASARASPISFLVSELFTTREPRSRQSKVRSRW